MMRPATPNTSLSPTTDTTSTAAKAIRMLITAGPTHEPIDAVRFLGNRSSGRMGLALARAGIAQGWDVTLLLGPTPIPEGALPPGVRTHRFRTCADLQSLLRQHAPRTDILVMAAAVADYRPVPNPAIAGGKFRRTDGPVTLQLESTPDLLAEVGRTRHRDQLLVGFALEPEADLLASARAKLQRKKIDIVVANPLETMDSDSVRATVLAADGSREDTAGSLSKNDFALWLVSLIAARRMQSMCASCIEGAVAVDAA